MTLSQVIEFADGVKPNSFTDDAKTQWVNECEGMVQTEIMLRGPDEIKTYTYAGDGQTVLLARPPHDKLYGTYLCAMIDFYNGEYSRYNNTYAMFNAHFGEYSRWYADRYRPADRPEEPCGF